MAIQQTAPENIINSDKNSKLKTQNLKLLSEFGYLVRGLMAWPLFALVVATSLLLTLAYQTPLDWTVKLGLVNSADRLYTQSFNQPEANRELSYRWTSAESRVRFPGVGRLPVARLDLTMQVGGRPANLGNAQVQIWHEKELLGQIEVGPGEKVYSFYYRPQNLQPSDLDGNLIFTIRVPNSFADTQHNLPLGVVVSEVRLVAGSEYNRPVVPALPSLALLLVGLIVFYLAMVRAGWTPIWAASWAGGLAILTALAIATVRLHLTPAIEPLFMVILLAYPLMALGLWVTKAWLKGEFPARAARWLGLIFMTAFVVKAAGMSHPAFNYIDHWFRVHQILRLLDKSGEFWAQYYNVSAGASVTGAESGSAVLGQWGVTFSLPYSPLFYIAALPLAFFWPTHDPNLLAAVNDLAAWLETSQIFLIYIIARRAYAGQWASRAGIIAAALLGFYPLSFLLFSDGGYNSILAHWLTLLFIALLVSAVRIQPSPLTPLPEGEGDNLSGAELPPTNNSLSKWSIWRWAALILTLAAALLAHTSTLLLVGTFVVILTSLWFVQKGTRWAAKKLAIVGGVALALSLLLYYGYYAINFITQSLPALLGKLSSSGNLGQNNALLGTRLLSGFWPQLWEHFRLFPFLLTVVAMIVLYLPQRAQRAQRNIETSNLIVNRQSRPRPLWRSIVNQIWVAWLAVFLLFSLADLKVNLLQKHMLFIAPMLCLGSGFALSLLWEYFVGEKNTSKAEPSPTNERNLSKAEPSPTASWKNWLVRGITGLLIAFIVWQGLVLWYGRIYYYVLPPGSG